MLNRQKFHAHATPFLRPKYPCRVIDYEGASYRRNISIFGSERKIYFYAHPTPIRENNMELRNSKTKYKDITQ